jgi:carbon starvation protein CstA
MDEKPVNKKRQHETLFLLALSITVIIILGFILTFLRLNHGLSKEQMVLIIIPIALFLGIYNLYYMYKKDLLKPEVKQGLKLLFERKNREF